MEVCTPVRVRPLPSPKRRPHTQRLIQTPLESRLQQRPEHASSGRSFSAESPSQGRKSTRSTIPAPVTASNKATSPVDVISPRSRRPAVVVKESHMPYTAPRTPPPVPALAKSSNTQSTKSKKQSFSSPANTKKPSSPESSIRTSSAPANCNMLSSSAISTKGFSAVEDKSPSVEPMLLHERRREEQLSFRITELAHEARQQVEQKYLLSIDDEENEDNLAFGHNSSFVQQCPSSINLEQSSKQENLVSKQKDCSSVQLVQPPSQQIQPPIQQENLLSRLWRGAKTTTSSGAVTINSSSNGAIDNCKTEDLSPRQHQKPWRLRHRPATDSVQSDDKQSQNLPRECDQLLDDVSDLIAAAKANRPLDQMDLHVLQWLRSTFAYILDENEKLEVENQRLAREAGQNHSQALCQKEVIDMQKLQIADLLQKVEQQRDTLFNVEEDQRALQIQLQEQLRLQQVYEQSAEMKELLLLERLQRDLRCNHSSMDEVKKPFGRMTSSVSYPSLSVRTNFPPLTDEKCRSTSDTSRVQNLEKIIKAADSDENHWPDSAYESGYSKSGSEMSPPTSLEFSTLDRNQQQRSNSSSSGSSSSSSSIILHNGYSDAILNNDIHITRSVGQGESENGKPKRASVNSESLHDDQRISLMNMIPRKSPLPRAFENSYSNDQSSELVKLRRENDELRREVNSLQDILQDGLNALNL